MPIPRAQRSPSAGCSAVVTPANPCWGAPAGPTMGEPSAGRNPQTQADRAFAKKFAALFSYPFISLKKKSGLRPRRLLGGYAPRRLEPGCYANASHPFPPGIPPARYARKKRSSLRSQDHWTLGDARRAPQPPRGRYLKHHGKGRFFWNFCSGIQDHRTKGNVGRWITGGRAAAQ